MSEGEKSPGHDRQLGLLNADNQLEVAEDLQEVLLFPIILVNHHYIWNQPLFVVWLVPSLTMREWVEYAYMPM